MARARSRVPHSNKRLHLEYDLLLKDEKILLKMFLHDRAASGVALIVHNPRFGVISKWKGQIVHIGPLNSRIQTNCSTIGSKGGGKIRESIIEI